MADIKAALFDYLDGISGITTAFGTPPRIYPATAPKSATTFPYAVVNRITNEHQGDFSGASGLVMDTFQFDVFDNDSVGLEAAVEALRNALDNYNGGTWGSVTVVSVFQRNAIDNPLLPKDAQEIIRFRTLMTFDIWYREAEPTGT